MARKQPRSVEPTVPSSRQPRSVNPTVLSPRQRDLVKRRLEQAFRREFPHDTIDIADGYADNIHVLVVSRRFDGLTPQRQQDLMWRIIESAGLSPAEKALISLVYPLSPADIR